MPTHRYLLRSSSLDNIPKQDQQKQTNSCGNNTDNMATKQDITDVFNKNKHRKTFEPHTFSGKSTDNSREFISSFNNYCKLNNVIDAERILTFEMCLSGAAKCWFHSLAADVKDDFAKISEQFEKNYLLNNKWINTTRLENRKLLTTESAENYIADMSELALLVGIKDDELAKALIRGLPNRLRWHVVSFNPTTLDDTIQRILLGEATLSWDDREEVNAVVTTDVSLALDKLCERFSRLEEMVKSGASHDGAVRQRNFVPRCHLCGVEGHISPDCSRRRVAPYLYNNQNNTYNRNPQRNDNRPYNSGFNNSTSFGRGGIGYNQRNYAPVNNGGFNRFNRGGGRGFNRNFGSSYGPSKNWVQRM